MIGSSMNQEVAINNAGSVTRLRESTALKLVYLLQAVFLVIALFGLDAPFLSVHFERQNQTFDIATHVFHEGFSAVIEPKASFSLPGYTSQPFTICRLEVPFHGLFGWPLAVAFGHERAAVRLVSVGFALLSIYLFFRTLRHWVDPAAALAGTALWATAPLVLQLGQAPMPDILCTSGVIAAFYFALKGNLPVSSGCFLFAILAKESVLPLGLPILVALLVAKECRSVGRFLTLSIAWGLVPILGLAAWISLDRFSPPTPWTILQTAADRNDAGLLDPKLYLVTAACLFPFGVGVVGMLGIASGVSKQAPRMNCWIRRSIVVACLVYFVFVIRKILEPQYFLPLVFWLALMASLGFARLIEKWRYSLAWRTILGVAICAHVLVVWMFTSDLKAARVSNLAGIESAAHLIRSGARVVLIYRHYGAGPAVWLNHNVVIIDEDTKNIDHELRPLKLEKFTYLMILDVESRHHGHASGEGTVTHFADPASPVRQFCDRNLRRLFDSQGVVLYSLNGLPADR
jgi:Dolichyl-phosphate-mannose-protein mannosyltransferase